MDLNFRSLRADEVECRVSTCRENGVQLLLYKDARCDMNILDEVVGPMNWMRSHSRDNANCIVSIWDEDKKQWISKEDTGSESNMEANKGLASDSFKRACFNWGIGRELYTGPFIWIPSNLCNIKQGNNGKYQCFDRFVVEKMQVTDGKITQLSISNRGEIVFKHGFDETPVAKKTLEPKKEAPKSEPKKIDLISRENANTILDLAVDNNIDLDEILKKNGFDDIYSLPAKFAAALYGRVKAEVLRRGNAQG